MSTKIYNGYKLPMSNNASFNKVMWFLEGKKKAIKSLANSLSTDSFLKLATGTFDATSLGRNKNKDSALSTTWFFVLEQVRKAKQENSRSIFDWSCVVVVLRGRRSMLALLYCEDPKLVKVASKGMEAYSYWDNTDRPDDVSEKEWNERGDEWDEALGWDPPSERGLAFTYVQEGWFKAPEHEEIRKILASRPKWASVGERALYQAKDIMMSRAYDRTKSVYKSVDVLTSEDGKKRVAMLAAKLEQRLVKNLSLEDLLRKQGDEEPAQGAGTDSKSVGARKGLGCEASLVRHKGN